MQDTFNFPAIFHRSSPLMWNPSLPSVKSEFQNSFPRDHHHQWVAHPRRQKWYQQWSETRVRIIIKSVEKFLRNKAPPRSAHITTKICCLVPAAYNWNVPSVSYKAEGCPLAVHQSFRECTTVIANTFATPKRMKWRPWWERKADKEAKSTRVIWKAGQILERGAALQKKCAFLRDQKKNHCGKCWNEWNRELIFFNERISLFFTLLFEKESNYWIKKTVVFRISV